MSTGGTHAGDRGRQEVTVFWASTRPLCCYFRRNYPVIPIPALSGTLSPLLATGHLVLVTSGERNFHTLVSPRVSDSLSSQLHPALHLPALVWPAPAMNINCLQFYAFQIPGFSHYFANTQKANLPSIDKIPAVGGSADYRMSFAERLRVPGCERLCYPSPHPCWKKKDVCGGWLLVFDWLLFEAEGVSHYFPIIQRGQQFRSTDLVMMFISSRTEDGFCYSFPGSWADSGWRAAVPRLGFVVANPDSRLGFSPAVTTDEGTARLKCTWPKSQNSCG